MVQANLILLADDDENDVFLVRRAFEKAGFPHTIVVAENGQHAVDYLADAHLEGNDSLVQLPALLLLDLHMPLMDGFDVLRWLATRPDLNKIAVVVLSSSCLDQDIQEAKALGADDYLVKPSRFEDLVKLAGELYARWLCDASEPKSATLQEAVTLVA